MIMLTKGTKLEFQIEYYDRMIGTIERIIKQDAHGVPCEWVYHIKVDSTHPRNSGTFVLVQSWLDRALIRAFN